MLGPSTQVYTTWQVWIWRTLTYDHEDEDVMDDSLPLDVRRVWDADSLLNESTKFGVEAAPHPDWVRAVSIRLMTRALSTFISAAIVIQM